MAPWGQGLDTSPTADERWLRHRLAAAALAAALVVAAACSSGDDDGGSAGAGSGAGADATASTAEVAATEADFAVPEERLDEIEAAGMTVTDVDYPGQPDGVPWPTDAWPQGDLPQGVDADEVQSVVDEAFAPRPDGSTIDAILVVQGGELVVEEYNGWDPAAPHNSWSMAKSITSSLVGILVGEGRLDVWEPVDAPEWAEPGDPRAAITLDHLLRMSSGLEWNESYADSAGDVLRSLGTDVDRAHYTASKPLADEPGTEWNYSTGTANLIARSVADEVGYGDAMVDWIDQALFGPLGITNVEHSVDVAGVVAGGSWINLSPQDFARFGLLYLRDGVWDGERILPEGWVDYSRMPTPNHPEGDYGAQWWVETDRPGAFLARGFNGQSITVMPDRDLVVVVLSVAPDGRDEAVRQDLLDAFGA